MFQLVFFFLGIVWSPFVSLFFRKSGVSSSPGYIFLMGLYACHEVPCLGGMESAVVPHPLWCTPLGMAPGLSSPVGVAYPRLIRLLLLVSVAALRLSLMIFQECHPTKVSSNFFARL